MFERMPIRGRLCSPGRFVSTCTIQKPASVSSRILSSLLTLVCCLSLLPVSSTRAAEISYEYDDAGRLTRTTQGEVDQTQYVLDDAGNRQSVVTGLAKVIRFIAPSATQAENGGNYSIVVKRLGDPSGAVGVSYSVTSSSPAGAPNFSVSNPGTLSWAANDMADKSIVVSITNDSIHQGNESVTIALSSPTGGARLGQFGTFALTITEDDPLPRGTLTLSPATSSIVEAAANVTFTVTRTSGSNGAVSVNFATGGGTASANVDYTFASGTLSWSDGDTSSKTFVVPIRHDTIYEPNETLNVTLSGVAGGATLGNSSAVITIVDNDVAVPGKLQFTPLTRRVTQNEGTTARLLVERVNGSDGPASVVCSTVPYDSNTKPNEDYDQPTNQPLTWVHGETTPKECVIQIRNDAVSGEVACPDPENSEFCAAGEIVYVELISPSGATTDPVYRTGRITIIDTTPAPVIGTAQFTTSSAVISETSGALNLTVTRTGASGISDLRARCSTTSGTAIASQDFSSTIFDIEWLDGDTSPKTCSIPLNNDDAYEPNETFTVTLTYPPNPALIGSPSTVSVTLTSDDALPAQIPGVPVWTEAGGCTPICNGGDYSYWDYDFGLSFSMSWAPSAGGAVERFEIHMQGTAYGSGYVQNVGSAAGQIYQGIPGPEGWAVFTVRACNSAGCSGFSNPLTVQIIDP